MIQIPRVGAPEEPVLEGWTALAGLAAVTSRIRLATLATAVGYRNPAHLAKIAASVDLISRGRLTLGIGAGFFEDEYKQYGWAFPPRPATRIRQMEEAVQLILKMWTEPRTTFHGRYFHVEDAILEPKPMQKPRPPVMIAGGGEQLTLRAVARLADACNLQGDVARSVTSWPCCAGTATQRSATTARLKRPRPTPGCWPATMPPWWRSASGWLPADRCATSSAPYPKPSIWSGNTRMSASTC